MLSEVVSYRDDQGLSDERDGSLLDGAPMPGQPMGSRRGRDDGREQSKKVLVQDEETGEQNYIRLEAKCARRFGPAAGIFLRQLVYWTGKEHDPNGWIYKTESEMEEETGLTRWHQRKARKILRKAGVLDEMKRSIPRKLYYRVDLEKLAEALDAESRIEGTPSKSAEVQESTPSKSAGVQGVKSGSYRFPTEEEAIDASQEGEVYEADKAGACTDPAITESTSETTTEISTENRSTERKNRAAHDSVPGKLATEDVESMGSLLDRERNPPSSEDRTRSSEYQNAASSSTVHYTRGSRHSKLVGRARKHKQRIDHRELEEDICELLGSPNPAVHWALVDYWEDNAPLSDVVDAVCRAWTGSLDEVEKFTDDVRVWVEYLTPKIVWQREDVSEWSA